MITRPMKATELKNFEEIRYPVIASPKVDGIRCLNPDGRIVAASFKPIPNDYIRTTLGRFLPIGADGELCTSSSFSKVSSDVMSKEGEPDFTFWMFDYVKDNLDKPYYERLRDMVYWRHYESQDGGGKIKCLPFKYIHNEQELKKYEEEILKQGFEGVIIRDTQGPYKNGRSTWKEQYLVKWKRFVDSEAEVIGLEEQFSNQNKLEKNELGLAKRSGKKEGKVPTGRLGKFLAKDIYSRLEFKCGTGQGLTIELREKIWNNQSKYIGRIFKYKYQPHGVKELPRLPIWLGWRDPTDMS